MERDGWNVGWERIVVNVGVEEVDVGGCDCALRS